MANLKTKWNGPKLATKYPEPTPLSHGIRGRYKFASYREEKNSERLT